jgi:hypothetical protein
MLDRLDSQVHVQVGPVQMMRRGQLHTHQLCYRRITKPRELLKRQEEFAVSKEEPQTVLRDVGYFNF